MSAPPLGVSVTRAEPRQVAASKEAPESAASVPGPMIIDAFPDHETAYSPYRDGGTKAAGSPVTGASSNTTMYASCKGQPDESTAAALPFCARKAPSERRATSHRPDATGRKLNSAPMGTLEAPPADAITHAITQASSRRRACIPLARKAPSERRAIRYRFRRSRCPALPDPGPPAAEIRDNERMI